ncbi:MAG: ComEC/Rec2 family competence protein [Candidatus Omnitrophota bacterium]
MEKSIFKRPIIIFILFFFSGLIAAKICGEKILTDNTKIISAGLCGIVFFSCCIFLKRKIFFTNLIILFFFLLGIYRFTAELSPDKNNIRGFVTEKKEKVLLYGVISGVPERKGVYHNKYLIYPLKAEKIFIRNKEYAVSGKVLVTLKKLNEEEPLIGDKIILGGKISAVSGNKNPGNRNKKAYFGSRGIGAFIFSSENDEYLKVGAREDILMKLWRGLLKIRNKSSGIIGKYLSGTTRAIVEALLLGVRGGIGNNINNIFIKTGTMHIVAISGLHMGMLAAISFFLAGCMRCPKRVTYVLVSFIMCFFALFSGGNPSATRAALMGTFFFLGRLISRKPDVLNVLLLTAFLMVFFFPDQLFNLGFSLSYTAVASILYIVPILGKYDALYPDQKERYERIRRLKKFIFKSALISLAVWIGTMPIIASCFKIITFSSIVANIFAVPFVFLIMIMGICLLFFGYINILNPVAEILALMIQKIIAFFLNILLLLSNMPLSYIKIASPKMIFNLFFYSIIIFFIFWKRIKKNRPILLFLLLFIANMFLWNEIFCDQCKTDKIIFFDSNIADISFFQFKTRETVLICGGFKRKWFGESEVKRSLEPYLRQRGIRRINCVILLQKYNKLPEGLKYLLKNFKINTLIYNGSNSDASIPEKSRLYKEAVKAVCKDEINCFPVQDGDVVRGIRGADFHIIYMGGEGYHDSSLVIKAVMANGKNFLLSSFLGLSEIKKILQFDAHLNVDIFKISEVDPTAGFVLSELLNQKKSANIIVVSGDISAIDKMKTRFFKEHLSNLYVTSEIGAIEAKVSGDKDYLLEINSCN